VNPSAQLDLVGIGWPICLLEYQQQVHRLEPGALIEIRIEDPEVAASIRQLAQQQQDRIVEERREGRFLRLRIQKHQAD